MALKNTQYDTLIREYNRRQLENKRLQDERIAAAYEMIPALADIDAQVASLGVAQARKLLDGDEDALFVLKAELQTLGRQRTQLLTENSFPADYLEMHYSCPDCRDTGYIENEKCHCFRQAAIDLLYTQSNIKEILQEENFDTFSYEYYSDKMINPTTGQSALATIKQVVGECKRFIADFDNTLENFFLYGNTGVGKTFLTHCIAKELLETSHSVIYFSAFELFDLFSKTTFRRGSDTEDLEQMHAHIFDCDLLIIDDLGTELTNSFVTSQLFLCINERLMRRKSTIISTNLSLDIFQDTYSERVFSRISSNYRMRKIIGDDIRIRKKLSKGQG